MRTVYAEEISKELNAQMKEAQLRARLLLGEEEASVASSSSSASSDISQYVASAKAKAYEELQVAMSNLREALSEKKRTSVRKFIAEVVSAQKRSGDTSDETNTLLKEARAFLKSK